MTRTLKMTNLCLSTLGALVLLVLTATVSGQARAESAAGYTTSSTAAPVVLAYYYGPRYYGPRWGGWNRHYTTICPRSCWRDGWGMRHCVRRC